jgi:hypothetical protein
VLTTRRPGLPLASAVWLSVYLLCVLCVASFIFFEVLDVDGSDMPTFPTRIAVRLADPPHDDLKRLQQPVKIWMGATVLPKIRPAERPERDARVRPSAVAPILECRAALPRAALGDASPSA